MNKRILSLTLSGFLIIILLDWSCTKLDTTSIGSDLIPAVDNINTFADTFAINTTQGVFMDTTKLTVSNTFENYVYGKNDDPVFGQTNATLFLQLKPNFYPYFIGNAGDTLIALDSVVLCLAYKGAYGDTSTPVTLQVNAIDVNAHDYWDSLGTPDKPYLHDINYAPPTTGPLCSPTTINLQSLSTYKLIGKGKDSVINQVRINLTDLNLRAGFANADSLLNHIYSRDTLFRAFNNGFAVTMTGGNALLYTQLSDPLTRLELHYKRKNGSVLLDTSMSVFTFNNGANGTAAPRRSAVADNIVRTGRVLPNPGDQEVYIQTAPGTFANLKIPQLSGYTNRVIHRAEIVMEEIPSDMVNDGYFTEPGYLYLDLVDSGTTAKWKPIYYDLNPSYAYDPDYKTGGYYFPGNNQVDYGYFGGTPKQELDATAASGKRARYAINITRYVQQIVTRQTPNYEMRLYAPYNIIYPQYKADVIPYSNNIAAGRVRLGGGAAIDPKYRMRLRIIYSKLK